MEKINFLRLKIFADLCFSVLHEHFANITFMVMMLAVCHMLKTRHVNYTWRILFLQFDPGCENLLTAKSSSPRVMVSQGL